MSGIVCAIRGGPASQPTIEQAIVTAKETGLSLHFVYIVNLDFLSHTASSRVQIVSEEMHQMGEFILLAAQSQAAAQKIAAEGEVRHGNVGEEIIKLCHEIQADYLVLGYPHPHQEESLFTHEALAEFSTNIEEQTGAKVILAGGQT